MSTLSSEGHRHSKGMFAKSGVGQLTAILEEHLEMIHSKNESVEQIISTAQTADSLRDAKKKALEDERMLLLSIIEDIGEMNTFLENIILIENLFNSVYQPYKQQQEQSRSKYAKTISKYENKPKCESKTNSFVELIFGGQTHVSSFQKWIDKVTRQCEVQNVKIRENSGAKMKKIERAFYKAFYVYDQEDGFRQMTDILRCSLVFDDFENLYQCFTIIETLAEQTSGGILRAKDRFHPAAIPFGYRDLLINIYCPESKIVAEIQLHFRPFYKYKKVSHKMYKRARLFERETSNLAYTYSTKYLRPKIGTFKKYELTRDDMDATDFDDNKEEPKAKDMTYDALLKQWGLQKYQFAMHDEGWDDPEGWGDLKPKDLKNDMGFSKGHINKFQRKYEEWVKLVEKEEGDDDDKNIAVYQEQIYANPQPKLKLNKEQKARPVPDDIKENDVAIDKGNDKEGSLNWMKVPVKGNRNNWTGQVGYEFVANKTFEINGLSRGIYDYDKNKLLGKTTVTLWDVATKTIMIQLDIGPNSVVKDKYAMEYIKGDNITLTKGKLYRISQLCTGGMQDKWNDLCNFDDDSCLNEYAALTQGCYNDQFDTTTFPYNVDGKNRRPGMVSFLIAIKQAISMTNWMTKQFRGHRNNWTGQVGYEFTANKTFEIKGLCRGISDSHKSKLSGNTMVTLWDVATKKIMIQLDIGPNSPVKDGYATEYVKGNSITLVKGQLYRISQLCTAGMQDKWNDACNFDTDSCLNEYATLTQGCYNNQPDTTTFPYNVDGKNRRPGMVSFVISIKQPDAINWMTKPFKGRRNNWTGQVGYEFVAHQSFAIKGLCRGIYDYDKNKLLGNTTVTLWDGATKQILVQLEVGPNSPVKDGYATEYIKGNTITLVKGKPYRISQLCTVGMQDKWNDAYDFDTDSCLNKYATLTQGCYNNQNDTTTFPYNVDGKNRRPGMVSFVIATKQESVRNWMTKPFKGDRNNWTGQVGYEFVAHQSFEIKGLCRGIYDYEKNKLLGNTTVTLWDGATKQILGQLEIGPNSPVKEGYATEYLKGNRVTLVKGQTYRISQLCTGGMQDKWNDACNFDANSCLNKYATLTQGCYNSQHDITTFPYNVDGKNRRAGMVSFCIKQ
eukprot:29351_1